MCKDIKTTNDNNLVGNKLNFGTMMVYFVPNITCFQLSFGHLLLKVTVYLKDVSRRSALARPV